VAEIARDTGITAQTIYNWRSQWQKQGQLVPASAKPPEQWSAADKLAAVIQAAGLSGTELGSFCREAGLPTPCNDWRYRSGRSAPATPGLLLLSYTTPWDAASHARPFVESTA
jgi:hypothetical protein